MTTCARSGGAILHRCINDRDAYWPLAQMQRDMDRIWSGPSTAKRVHEAEIAFAPRLRWARQQAHEQRGYHKR